LNYAKRYRAGLRVGTSITEGAANFLVYRRRPRRLVPQSLDSLPGQTARTGSGVAPRSRLPGRSVDAPASPPPLMVSIPCRVPVWISHTRDPAIAERVRTSGRWYDMDCTCSLNIGNLLPSGERGSFRTRGVSEFFSPVVVCRALARASPGAADRGPDVPGPSERSGSGGRCVFTLTEQAKDTLALPVP
jgi:hypothetical protein